MIHQTRKSKFTVATFVNLWAILILSTRYIFFASILMQQERTISPFSEYAHYECYVRQRYFVPSWLNKTLITLTTLFNTVYRFANLLVTINALLSPNERCPYISAEMISTIEYWDSVCYYVRKQLERGNEIFNDVLFTKSLGALSGVLLA